MRSYRMAKWLLPIIAVLCLVTTIFLGRSVYTDLNELRSAKSDTVQWTLSQIEIEFVDLQLSANNVTSGYGTLDQLRKDFDVFYSRFDIISQSPVFASARAQTSFSEAGDKIRAFLDRTVPPIDSSDTELMAAMPTILTELQNLRPVVRGLYVSGLAHFAADSDQLRKNLAETLLVLSATAAFLVVSLGILAGYSRAATQRSWRRGKELVRANARMETILSTSLDGVVVSDRSGHVVDFNAAAEKIFGYNFEDIRGQSIGDLIVPPAMREAHEAGMQRMLTTGEKKLVGHGRIRIDAQHAKGHTFPVELALQSATSEDGEIIIAFLRDISEDVAREEELRNARDQALAGEKAKAEFLTVMSHEIRTPLSGLLGNLSLMGKTKMSREQKQFEENMQISGRQLMKHVNAVLDIARFESGNMEVEASAFDPSALVKDIVDGLSGNAEKRRNSIGWSWTSNKVDWISMDRGHLETILMNLVGNAIKFTESGRVEIEVEATSDQADMLEFRVIDTGIGVAEDNLDKVFADFETVRRAGGETGSTGLGLGIAKRLVKLMGGDIGVESTLGEGSVFWVRLPYQIADQNAAKDDVQDDVSAPTGLNVLVAEDNEMNAFVVKKMLADDGHTVTIAEDGLQAVDKASKGHFDVILMDINMPKLNGLEATKRIRETVPEMNNVPIFAFSANVLPDDMDRFRANGMDGFIGKPIQQQELRQALASVGSVTTAKTAPSPSPAKDMFGDQYDTFRERFVSEADQLVDWLINHGTEDLEETFQRCHKTASTAALFGTQAFHKALQKTETAAKNQDSAKVQKQVTKIAAIWDADRNSL